MTQLVLRHKNEVVFIGPPKEANAKMAELLNGVAADGEDVYVHTAAICGGCGSAWADQMEALSCSCHDH